MALNGAPHSGVIRAKRPEDGAILGSVVIYNSQSAIAEYIPALHKKDKEKEKVNGSNSSANGSSNGVTAGGGGVSSPVISPSVGEYATLMQGLILLGIKQVRKSGADAVMLDCVRF